MIEQSTSICFISIQHVHLFLLVRRFIVRVKRDSRSLPSRREGILEPLTFLETQRGQGSGWPFLLLSFTVSTESITNGVARRGTFKDLFCFIQDKVE